MINLSNHITMEPVRSESELLAAATLTTELCDILDGKVETLDPWDYFAIRDFELNGGCICVGVHTDTKFH